MKTLSSVCAGIAVVSSIMTVSLWLELKSERQAISELRSELIDARNAGRNALVPASMSASTAAPAPVATATAEAPVCKADSPDPKPASAPNVVSLQDSMNMEKDLMKDPEYRKLRVAQQRSNIERNYPGLAEALALSEKEAGKLFDLLAENQVAMSTESILLTANGNPDPAAMEEMSRRQQAMQREQEEALRSLLGGKYGQWQEYQQTRSSRTRVTSMGSQLAQAGMPLTDAQSRALTTALIAEQQRQRQNPQLMPQAIGLNPNDPDFRARMLEESMKRSEENNRRMLDAAAPHLSARQLAALREQIEQQAGMSRISMRMQMERERLQSQQSQQPQATLR